MEYAFVEPESGEGDVESQRQHVAHYIQKDDSETQLSDIIVSNFGRTDYIDWKKEVKMTDSFESVLEKIKRFECREPVCDLLPYPFVVFDKQIVDTIITDQISGANIDSLLARFQNLMLYNSLRESLLNIGFDPTWAHRLDSSHGANPAVMVATGKSFCFCTVEIIGWWHLQQKINIVYVSY